MPGFLGGAFFKKKQSRHALVSCFLSSSLICYTDALCGSMRMGGARDVGEIGREGEGETIYYPLTDAWGPQRQSRKVTKEPNRMAHMGSNIESNGNEGIAIISLAHKATRDWYIFQWHLRNLLIINWRLTIRIKQVQITSLKYNQSLDTLKNNFWFNSPPKLYDLVQFTLNTIVFFSFSTHK